jgi:hypothetical protein
MQDEREREAIAQEAIRGVILRRRDDTFERVIREDLGGALFATEGQVDKWFPKTIPRELHELWEHTEIRAEDFARKGNVDSYFNLNHCGNKLEDELGQVCLCWLPMGHAGSHENESVEWWNDDSNELTIHAGLVESPSWPLPENIRKRYGPLYWRIRTRYEMHLLGAAERETEALRAANTRQGIERLWRTR